MYTIYILYITHRNNYTTYVKNNFTLYNLILNNLRAE